MENKQEWLMERKNYIGGSDLGAIAGLNPYRTALDVYLDKTSDDITDETSPAMRWGNLLEDVVAKAYSEDTGQTIEIEPNTIYHPEYKFLGANIDRWVGDKEYVLAHLERTCKKRNLDFKLENHGLLYYSYSVRL